MGVDLGGFHVGMAEQVLNGADVDTCLQKVRGEAMSKYMRG
jgi:hypothetical protein